MRWYTDLVLVDESGVDEGVARVEGDDCKREERAAEMSGQMG